MAAYASKDLDIVELKSQAQQEWEARDRLAAPNLALMTRADIHGSRTEQQLGRETLVSTQAGLMEATGASTLSDESRQLLLLSVSTLFTVSILGNVLGYVVFNPLFSLTRVRSLFLRLLYYLLAGFTRSSTIKPPRGQGYQVASGEPFSTYYHDGWYGGQWPS